MQFQANEDENNKKSETAGDNGYDELIKKSWSFYCCIDRYNSNTFVSGTAFSV